MDAEYGNETSAIRAAEPWVHLQAHPSLSVVRISLSFLTTYQSIICSAVMNFRWCCWNAYISGMMLYGHPSDFFIIRSLHQLCKSYCLGPDYGSASGLSHGYDGDEASCKSWEANWWYGG